MREIVFSKLLLLVDGLVIVVPRELCLPCPFLNDLEGEGELTGDPPAIPEIEEVESSFAITVSLPTSVVSACPGEEGAVVAPSSVE